MELLRSHWLTDKHIEKNARADVILYTWLKKFFKLADTEKRKTLSCAQTQVLLKKHPAIWDELRIDVKAIIKRDKAMKAAENLLRENVWGN